MKLKNVVYKNFKYNVRKFLNYFISNSFCIMIFFILLTFVFNEEFKKRSASLNGVDGVIITSLIMIAVFSFIFINYTYSCFFRTRFKEFGLYLTLGMTKSNIRTMMFIESIITTFLSIIAGLVCGSVFGRLFFIGILKMSNFDKIKFSYNIRAYITTIIVFITIFSLILILSLFKVRKLHISEIFDADKKEEKRMKSIPIVAFMGIILIIVAGAIVFKYSINESDSGNRMITAYLIAFILYILGTYLFISQFGNLFLTIIRRNKNLYYRNLINVTNIKYKFIQNKNILFVNTVLIMIVIFTIGIYYDIYNQSLAPNPYDITYAEVFNINRMCKLDFENLKKNDNPLEKNECFEFIHSGKKLFENDYERNDLIKKIIIMSDKEFNRFFETNFKVKKSYGININIYDKKVLEEYNIIKNGKLKINLEKSELIFNIEKKDNKYISPRFYHLLYNTLIINVEDYDTIKRQVSSERIGKYHVLKFKNWTKTKNIAVNLQNQLKSINESKGLFNNISPLVMHDFEDFKVKSRIIESQNMKKANSFQFFLYGFVGGLFFLASCGITYIKLNADIEDEKVKYKKINGIGITKNEIKGYIFKENILIFFFPLIIGSIIAYSCLFTLFSLWNCESKQYIQSLSVFLIFFIMEVIYYLISCKKYFHKIIKDVRK